MLERGTDAIIVSKSKNREDFLASSNILILPYLQSLKSLKRHYTNTTSQK